MDVADLVVDLDLRLTLRPLSWHPWHHTHDFTSSERHSKRVYTCCVLHVLPSLAQYKGRCVGRVVVVVVVVGVGVEP